MANTKDRIHKAIWSIICEDEASSLRVADIAIRAGIGKSTVYEYFKDKDHAISSAIINCCDNIVEKYDKIDLLKMDFNSAFTEMCLNMMDVSEEYGENLMSAFIRLSTINIESIQKIILNLKIKYVKSIQIILDKGKNEGLINSQMDELDISFAAEFVAIAIGSYFRIPELKDGFSKDEYIIRIRNAFLKLVY